MTDERILLFFLIATFGTTFASVQTSPIEGFKDDVTGVAENGQEQQPQDTAANVATVTTKNANVIVDDKMKIYADGVLLGKSTSWYRAKQFQFQSTAEVIAIEATNINPNGAYGIRASFDGVRLVTDTERWRCRSSKSPDWLNTTFDDSQWPLAKEVEYSGNAAAIQNKDIVNVNAKWIWTGSSEDETVYCRAFLDVDGYVQVDDKMEVYADGVLKASNNQWTVVKQVTLPGSTHVIAISGLNIGGPYGIRASFAGQKLITSDMKRWRCTNTLVTGWEKPSFDDRSWPVAKAVRHHRTDPQIASTAKWIWSQIGTNKAYCRAFFHMYATLRVDDEFELYADGVLMGANNVWSRGVRLRLPGETSVIAIMAKNYGQAKGIKGFFAAGRLITDETWRCTNGFTLNWQTQNFDDSQWPAAKPRVYRGNKAMFSGVGVKGHNSKWIWAADESATTVYCRGYIRKVPGLAAAVGNVEDQNSAENELSNGNNGQENQIIENNAQNNEANVAQSDVGEGNVPVARVGNVAVGNRVGGNTAVGYKARVNTARGHRVFRKRPMISRFKKPNGRRVFMRRNKKMTARNNAVNKINWADAASEGLLI